MERCVARLSRHLNDRHHALFSQKTRAMLFVAFRNKLWTRLARSRRTESLDDLESLEHIATKDWADEVELRVDFEKFTQLLSERARRILALRDAGDDWEEIAAQLGISASPAQNSFSRELRKARSLLNEPRPKDSSGKNQR